MIQTYIYSLLSGNEQLARNISPINISSMHARFVHVHVFAYFEPNGSGAVQSSGNNRQGFHLIGPSTDHNRTK
jgi:hypothetical protein